MSNSEVADFFDSNARNVIHSLSKTIEEDKGGDGVEVMLSYLENSSRNSVGYEDGEFFLKFDETFIYLYESGDYFIKWAYWSVSGISIDNKIFKGAIKAFGYLQEY